MPKRIGFLFDQCFSEENLYRAYLKARKGKGKTISLQEFEYNLGVNLYNIRQSLYDGSYRPDPYREFMITEPKPRLISAPSFKDRIVQHAIYNVIYPIFDKTFIFHNYGCRIRKGTHKAADQTQDFLRRSKANAINLQLDIKKFYRSINPNILQGLIRRKIKDQRLLSIINRFIPKEHGLPIGNLLSQLFGLIYLTPLDRFVKSSLRIKFYIRYVDDFILFNLTKDTVKVILRKIETFLKTSLELSLSSWQAISIKKGINFVGFRTWKSRRFLRKHSLYSFSKALKNRKISAIVAILGHAQKTSSFSFLFNLFLRTFHA